MSIRRTVGQYLCARSQGAGYAARFLLDVQRSPAAEIFVPWNMQAKLMFVEGDAEGLILGTPPRVKLYRLAQPPEAAPGRAIFPENPSALDPGQRLPGWSRRWDPVRTVARAIGELRRELGLTPWASPWNAQPADRPS